MIKPNRRVRTGLRFILIGLMVRSGQKIQDRLLDILGDVCFSPAQSILLNLKAKHQMIALTTLTLTL